MKKLLLLAAIGLTAMASQAADTYTVYNNGTLGANLNVEYWWNTNGTACSFTAPSPVAGETDKVFLFKAGNLTYDWGQGGYADASMGLNMVAPGNTGSLHNATLNFDYYATGSTNATYTIRLTSIATNNCDLKLSEDQMNKWVSVSLPVAEKFPDVAQEWNNNANLGEGYVFSIIIAEGTEDNAIYFKNIQYTNVDENWKAPEVTIAAPENVPTPTQPASDVVSIFSNAYTAATGFNIGQWGQSTNATLNQIDGKDVYYFRNFNYLGWELTSDVNVADYDYLHVDYWTETGTTFGITPVTREGNPKELGWNATAQGETVAKEQWNSYDIPLSYYAGLDLATVFQIKFDYGGSTPENVVNGYVANVYFWKEGNGEGGDQGDDDKNQMTFTANDVKYTVDWTATWNADKTVTFNLTISPEGLVGMVPQMFAEGAFEGNFEAAGSAWTYTTKNEYEEGTTPNLALFVAYAGGATDQMPFNYTVEGSGEPGPGEGGDQGDDDKNQLTFTANDVKYTVDWTATWNADKTITFNLTISPEGLVGMVPQMFVDGAFEGNFEAAGSAWTYTTKNEYEEGTTPNLALYVAYAGGATDQMPFNYTVEGEGGGGTDAIMSIGEGSEAVEFFNLQGVKVQNPQHGIYIIRQGDKSRKVVIR